MNNSEKVSAKREKLGLSLKELSDAIGLGKDGDKKLRAYENGEAVPQDVLDKILSYGEKAPFCNRQRNSDFTFIDLFAGIGGIRLPFQEKGGKCVFSSEWDKFSQKTYRMNFGETPEGDITKISSEDIPDFDILLGGFPCQPFSQAGLHKGFDDTREATKGFSFGKC